MSIYKYFLIHLTVSLGAGCVALILVFWLWYPSPFDQIIGVSTAVRTLLLVDLAIGPLLGLSILRRSTPNFRIRLSAIIALQFLAFVYGANILAQARPAWIVFNVDRFDLAQAQDLDDRYLTQAHPEFRRAPWNGPKWVASEIPRDLKRRNLLILESSAGGFDLPQRPDLYTHIFNASESIREKSRRIDELELFNSPHLVQLARIDWPAADAWLPFVAHARAMVVFIDRKNGKPISIVDLRPWD